MCYFQTFWENEFLIETLLDCFRKRQKEEGSKRKRKECFEFEVKKETKVRFIKRKRNQLQTGVREKWVNGSV